MRATILHGVVLQSSCGATTLSQPVRQAPVEPGKQKIKVPLARPPIQRDAIVDVPIS